MILVANAGACWEPSFQETGTNCPSSYPDDKQKDLIQLSIDTTLALGFENGCFHVEAKYTSRGPRIIEVNARMGGVSVRDVNLHAWGVVRSLLVLYTIIRLLIRSFCTQDLVEQTVMTALRIPIRPALPEKPLEYMAECVVNSPYSGVINADGWLDFVLEDKRVHKVNYLKKKGEKVLGPEDGMPDWLVEILVISKTSQEEACDLIRDIVTQRAPVPITPKREDTERRPFFFPEHKHPFARSNANGFKLK